MCGFKVGQSWRLVGERVHSLKNSAMTVKGVCRLCTNCLSTPKKSGKYPNQPLSYAFLVKIIMPGGLTVQKPAAGWETFSTVTKFFLLGRASLGIETSHWKEVCTAPRKSVIWNDIMVRCHIFVRQGFKNPSHGVWSLMRYPPKFNRHQNFDDSSCRPLRPRAKKYCKKEDFCNMK